MLRWAPALFRVGAPVTRSKKNALVSLPKPVEDAIDPNPQAVETFGEAEDFGTSFTSNKVLIDSSTSPAGLVLESQPSNPEAVAALISVAKPTEEPAVPTKVTLTSILGRFRVDGKEYVGDRNGTRWIADVELNGSTAVDLKIELLGHGTGAPIVPPLASFTLGAGNGNFYVARPHIVEEKGVLFLRTVALKMSAKVKLRLAVDTYHSSNR